MLEACKKEHQKLYLEHEKFKKYIYEQQQEELLKHRNHYRGSQTTNKTPQDRKINLSDIEIHEEKWRNLLSAIQNRKPKKKCYVEM